MEGLFCGNCNRRWYLSNIFSDFSIGIPLVLRYILCHILRFLVPLLPSVQVNSYFIYISLQFITKFLDIIWAVLCIFTKLVIFFNSRVNLPSTLISPCHSIWCKTNANFPFVGYCDGPCRASNSFCHCFATIYSCLICGFTLKKSALLIRSTWTNVNLFANAVEWKTLWCMKWCRNTMYSSYEIIFLQSSHSSWNHSYQDSSSPKNWIRGTKL